jgi:sugar phosphate isomerase/epimerase
MKFCFHNHTGDFALDGGTPIYDTLLAETDPRLVYFEMDIAWFVAGGADPYATTPGNVNLPNRLELPRWR